MKKYLLATAIAGAFAFGAHAQTTPAPSTPDGNTPAIVTNGDVNPTAPVEGANSFTEEQAAERLAAAGLTEVTGLFKDDKGVWQAKAVHAGKPVAASLDYQGNIVVN